MTPSDVVRKVLELIAARRYEEVAEYVDGAQLRELLAREVEMLRSRPPRLVTAEDIRRSDPDMPPEVVEYQFRQAERAQRSYDPLAGRFARVTSVEELERLGDAGALARLLEAREHHYQLNLAMEAQSDRLPAGWKDAAPDPEEWPVPRVLGEVRTGDHAIVLYAPAGAGGITPHDVQHALLRLSDGKWKMVPEGGLFGHAGGMTVFQVHTEAYDRPLEHEPSGPPPVQQPWTERSFETGLGPERFPAILERFRSTAPRLTHLLHMLPRDALRWHAEPTGAVDRRRWSIQEHIGHLLDLEELGERRLREYLSGAEALSPADMTNRKTHEAGHDERNAWELVWDFERGRQRLVDVLETLGEDDLRRTASHPRLKQPMTVVDWVHFMCEHDDHHLARIAELRRAWAGTR